MPVEKILPEKEARQEATALIQGASLEYPRIILVVNSLVYYSKFSLARKVLAKVAPDYPNDPEIQQKYSLCTYKDMELPPMKRFQDALSILERIGLRDPDNQDLETLGQGASIYKQMWQSMGNLEYLHNALQLYLAGYQRTPDPVGWAGINAAYVLQVLASRARMIAARTGTKPFQEQDYQTKAEEILRENVLKLSAKAGQLAAGSEPDADFWRLASLAEARFGLKEYPTVVETLTEAMKLGPPEWMIKTTFRQLLSLARIQNLAPPNEKADPATWPVEWQGFVVLLGDDAPYALSSINGKVGLALSGGGFRASLFHIGVLARLAEMDVLRSVEVLSTVSGGSIVGAEYYLRVRKLLMSSTEKEIQPDHYLKIVRELESDFLAGVQKNLRTRAVASIINNLKMIFSNSYTRTNRIGELFERYFYRKNAETMLLKDLKIEPNGNPKGTPFNPKEDNWKRQAKVPSILLNATNLNSGHNFQFTTSWMGEPPGLIGLKVDKNARYRRLSYSAAPQEQFRDLPLGAAVAASACVPGLFEPLPLEKLYADRLVRLVDGGVHDNQGVAGLLDENCSFILCSDASGQMADLNEASNSLLGVPLRSASISMSRVRDLQYQDLTSRENSRSIEGLFFIHLKQDLLARPIEWINSQNELPPPENCPLTSYFVHREIQNLLASMRTDLDSFSEIEAYSLMASGYLMTKQEFMEQQEVYEKSGGSGNWGGYNIDAPSSPEWKFMGVVPHVQMTEGVDPIRQDILRQLRCSSKRAFKVFYLVPWLKWSALLAALVLLFGVGTLIRTYWDYLPFSTLVDVSIGKLVIALVIAIALAAIPWIKLILFPEKVLRLYIFRSILAAVAYVLSNLHILLFDRIFLSRGTLHRLKRLRKS